MIPAQDEAALERLALQGEEVARLLACDAVRDMLQEQLTARREALFGLDATDTAGFVRCKAGLDALEQFAAGLESLAAQGQEARQRLADGGVRKDARVL